MKVQELVEFITSNKNKILKADQLLEVVKKQIQTKDYVSIKQKRELVDSIVDDCILFEDGIFKFDEIDKYVCFTMKTIEAYTNLELSPDLDADYDMLCESKALNVVIDTFAGEYENVRTLLQMKCDYILSQNNIDAQVGKFLNGILEKVEDVSSALSLKVKEFDIKNLPFSMEDLSKLLSFIGANKK